MNRQTIIDLLAAGRVANLPSVVSNVVFGAVTTGWLVHANGLNLFWPSVAGVCLYLGGCFLNDWSDRQWDGENKPERAIPSGRLSAAGVLFLALVFLLGGIVCSFFQSQLAGIVGLVVAAAIMVYTWIHKKTILGVLPMGLCRGGLYFLGLASQSVPDQIFKAKTVVSESSITALMPTMIAPAFGLAAFVAGLSLLARYEAKGVIASWQKWLAYVLLLMPGLRMLTVDLMSALLVTVVFVLVVLIGHRALKQSIGKGVSFLLASICLVDLIPLLLAAPSSNQPNLWPFVGVSSIAFLLALLLQRIAPAT